MKRAQLTALAERVMGLSGPDRGVDALVALAIGWSACQRQQWFTPPGLTVKHHRSELPRYTADLNAAMAMVPPNSWHEIKGPRKYLNIPTPAPNYWSVHLASWNHKFQVMGWGATPALALTAAALLARAAECEA